MHYILLLLYSKFVEQSSKNKRIFHTPSNFEIKFSYFTIILELN